jgi:flagellar biosynthesis chaperone FliJ
LAFRFSLQKILDIKQDQLIEAEKNERIWKARVEAIEARIENLRLAYFADREALNTQVAGSALAERHLYEGSLESKKQLIMGELRKLSAARASLAEWGERALGLRKKVKALEKVKSRRQLEFDRREEKILQGEIDSRAALRAWRNSQEDGQL